MTVAFERFKNDAVRIDQHVNSMTENRDRFVHNIDHAIIRDDQAEFFANRELNILVITEDWCVDSVQFIPVLARLARDYENIDVRALRRDEHADLAEQYPRKDGYNAIPIIIAFDSDGNELGVIVERPEKASSEMAEETRRFQEANPDLEGVKRNIDRMPKETQEKVKTHSRRWRMTQQDRFTDHMLNELRDLIQAAQDDKAA
jgi:thiol-disulfide isomerase/thioredoxin